MRKMKKLVSLVLAMVMVLAMTMNVSAAGEGKITINDAVSGQEYSVYQILDLESYNVDDNAFAYKATENWSAFINGTDVNGVYVKVDDQGYVTWVENVDAAAFAKLAQAYAQKNNIAAQATKEAESTTVVFEGLDLGYYLVDTTLGTICSLNTTKPEAVIEEKNEAPSITKEVEEDSTGNYGETNDADFNQTVNYKAAITVQAGAENYIMHDTMDDGLTFDVNSVKVTVDGIDVDDTNYTVSTNCVDGCTFEVAFDNTYIASVIGKTIVVSYSAKLNENAVVGLPGNVNEVELQYGDVNHPTFTPEDTTTTYTWDMDILKYANDDESKVLADAQFVLLNKEKTMVAKIVNGKLVEWVEFAENDDLSAYALTTDANGKIEIDGLDADTYYLREIKAPAGYNKLAEDVEVIITGVKEVTGENGTTTLEYSTVVAKVNNNSGTELPSTGGMGTTIFYLVGGALVVLAAVLLITRKRMSAE